MIEQPEIRYTPNDDDAQAVIRLEDAARWVADYYPVDVLEDGTDGMVIRMSVGDPAVAARLLVRLGDAAHLLEGGEVAAATGELRRRILARYAADAQND